MGEIEDLVDRLKHHHQLKFMTPSHISGEPYQMVPLELLCEAEDAILALSEQLRISDLEGEHAFALAVDDPGKNPPVAWKDIAEAAELRVQKLKEALMPFAEASDNADDFWAEETGGQEMSLEEDDEMVTFFTLGVDLDMVPLSKFRAAKAAVKDPKE